MMIWRLFQTAQWANPEYFWLLLLLPLVVWLSIRQNRRRGLRFQLSSTSNLKSVPASAKVRAMRLLPVLLVLGLVSFVFALARPQETNTRQSVSSEGIDIVISLDISGSMLAEDFQPNRIEAAKTTAIDFIRKRPTDRIGLVIFAGESFTQCPITIDHDVLAEQLMKVKSGLLEDGTAIGMGLGTAVDRLRNATGKSKVVILLTDGVNNTGKIDPLTALEIAKAFGVRVYTVGVGTQGEALYPIPTPLGVRKQMVPVEIDEPLLKRISKETGGKYYRATNNASLEGIYEDIDQLEKTKIEVSAFRQHSDRFFPFVLLGIGCLSLYLLLQHTFFRSVTS